MALLCPIEVGDTGMIAGYWRIGHVHADFSATVDGVASGIADVTMFGYVSDATRIAGKAPIDMKQFRFTSGMFPNGSFDNVSREMIYFGLKQFPVFAGATDI